GKADVPEEDIQAYRWAAKFGAWVLIASSVVTIFSGDAQAKAITHMQPAKLAAAEGAFEDTGDFSLLTIPNADQTEAAFEVKVPMVLSIIAGVPEIKGIDTIREEFPTQGFRSYEGTQTQLQEQYAPYLADRYSEINPIPDITVTYWSFRLMMAFGMAGVLIGLLLLWTLRKGGLPKPSKLWTGLMAAMPLLPLFGISFGWIFTEMGRQPWLVAGVLPTQAGVSPSASANEVLFSLIVYTLLYGVLAVIEVGLFLYYTKKGLPDVTEPQVSKDPDAPMSFAY
ncbi:MAG: cytochrome ubiquinol oxidase subunit I, partial [Propionibacteriaceae bacterium]|nr:cytochrome ubiquinol oxidase subunit I [Propionibacteriaceae bacterium]